MEPWQHQRQQVGLGWGDGAPLTARQGAVVARLFALHGEHYGLSSSVNPVTTAQDEGAARSFPAYAAAEPPGALLDDEQDEQDEDDAGERVQGELYAWLDHHPNPEQAQACGMALTDLVDGRGWCADLDRELDQVFDTLTELERRCAGLKQSGEAVGDALRHSIGLQLQLEEDAMKPPGRISAFGARLLAIDKEQVLPLPLPTDLRQREAREQEERAASATARELLERMNARTKKTSTHHHMTMMTVMLHQLARTDRRHKDINKTAQMLLLQPGKQTGPAPFLAGVAWLLAYDRALNIVGRPKRLTHAHCVKDLLGRLCFNPSGDLGAGRGTLNLKNILELPAQFDYLLDQIC